MTSPLESAYVSVTFSEVPSGWESTGSETFCELSVTEGLLGWSVLVSPQAANVRQIESAKINNAFFMKNYLL